MGIFRNTWKSEGREPLVSPVPEGEVTNADIRSAYDDFTYYVTGRVDAKANTYSKIWEDRINEVEKNTGTKLPNPGRHYGPDFSFESVLPPVDQEESTSMMGDMLFNPKTRQEIDVIKQKKYDEDVQAFNEFVAKNEFKFSADSKVFHTDNQIINNEVTELVDNILTEKSRIDQRTNPDLLSFDSVQRLAGGVTGSITDPVNIGATAASMMLPVNSVALRLLAAVVENAGAEALIQTEVREWYKEIGIDYTDEDFVNNVVAAGAAGLFLGGTVEIGSKAIKLTTDQAIKGIQAYRGVKLKDTDALEFYNDLNKEITQNNPIKNDSDNVEHLTNVEKATEKVLDNDLDNVPKLEQDQIKQIEETVFDKDNLHERKFKPGELLIDAERFQFKTGGDARGMTDALMGVERWDPIKSSTILVWRDKEGKHFVADGHQRVNLAQRLEKKGQDIELYAHVINEDDGFNPATARAIGARKNLAEGTATEFDAARALKLDPDALDNLPPRSKYVQFAQGISQVADNVLVAAENMEVSPAYVSMIGRNFADATEQEAMLKLLNRLQPSNQTKAESIIAQAREAGFVTKQDIQQGLFGDEVLLENLFNERADVLDSSLKLINTEKQVFSTLVNNSDFIQKYGNKLDKTTNLQRKNLNAEIQETIKHNANVKGEISEELSRLARELQEGKVTLSQAARQFVERVGDRFRDGGFTRIDTRATRSHDDVKEILSQANEPKRTRETAEELEPYANTEMFDVDSLEQNVQALNDTMKDIDPNYQLDIDDGLTLEQGLEANAREKKIIDELDKC